MELALKQPLGVDRKRLAIRIRFAVICIHLLLAAVAGCRAPFGLPNLAGPASYLKHTANVTPPLQNASSSDWPLLPDTSRPLDISHPVQPASADVTLLTATISALTLDHAIAVSLDRNPALVAIRASEPVAHAAYHVSEVYPWNPFVQVQVLPYAHEKFVDNLAVNHYVWLMQTIELAHQRKHRKASASAALSQVRWNIVQAELTNAAQTERLYFTAHYQHELRDLAKQTATLNEELLGSGNSHRTVRARSPHAGKGASSSRRHRHGRAARDQRPICRRTSRHSERLRGPK